MGQGTTWEKRKEFDEIQHSMKQLHFYHPGSQHCFALYHSSGSNDPPESSVLASVSSVEGDL